MEALNLKGSHAIYLVVLYNNQEGLTSTALAQMCGRDKADVCRAIAHFDKEGLIFRDIKDNKNYRTLLFLTEKGEQAAKRLCHKAKSAVEYTSAGLSDKDIASLYSSLEVICTNIEKLSENGIPDYEKLENAQNQA